MDMYRASSVQPLYWVIAYHYPCCFQGHADGGTVEKSSRIRSETQPFLLATR